MFRSTWLKTLRDLRWQVLGWGGGMAVLVLASAAAFVNAFPDSAARAKFAADITGSLSAAQILFGPPANLLTLPGLMEWRGMGWFPVLLGIFAVLAATGISRGREERGELDVVLAAERGRGRLFAGQAAGLALAYLLVCLAIWIGLLLCGPLAGLPLNAADAALSMLNYGLGGALFGGFALLVAQFATTRRGAALASGGALVAAHIWANLGLVATALEPARPLSPLSLAGRSAPLATGHTDFAALIGLAALTLALTALAGWLFSRRDLGAATRLPLPAMVRRIPAPGSAERRGSTALLGNPFGRGLRGLLGTALVWGAGLGVFAVLLTAVTPAMNRAFAEQANLRDFAGRLDRGNIDTGAGFLSFGLFGFLPLLVTISAATFASAWSSEERNGQLELDLAAPVPRGRSYLARAGAVLAGVVVTIVPLAALFLLTIRLAGVHIAAGRALEAALLLAPVGWVVAAAGFAIAGLRPGLAGALLTPLLALSYFFDLLAPLFKLPNATREFSIFHLYGRPLTSGPNWPGLFALLAMTALFLAAGWAAFVRRDIAK